MVFSGGGSKGIAHAGVMQYLQEQNIKPSCIAGSSAGAIVGAMYAFGKKPEEILEFFKSIYFFHWKHFTFKKAGLLILTRLNTIFTDFWRCYFRRIKNSNLHYSNRYGERKIENF